MVTDKTRRSTFIEQNLGLVHSCAGRFRGRGIEYDDLYSAGCMGLVKAYDGFDESRGVCFSTYAVPVILGEIKKLFRDGGTVKVSRSLKELSLRINAAREHHSKLCGAEPTLSQLAEELGESVEIRVKDIGIGIPREDCSRVFERFYRVDKSHSKAIGGTGLGLSIVKHGVTFLGGTLKMLSEVGKGTEITMTFPKE